MRLNDALVTSFIYKETEYTMDLSFDNVLDVFDVLDDDSFRDYEKIDTCLKLILDDQEHEPSVDLWNYIFESFIKIKRKKSIQYDRAGNPMPMLEDEEEERLMDLEQDAELIYASFKQAYQMDLYEEQRKLHWHKFHALLQGLPSDTILQRVIQIRQWKPSKGDSKENIDNMKKLQRSYALSEEVE